MKEGGKEGGRRQVGEGVREGEAGILVLCSWIIVCILTDPAAAGPAAAG